MDGARAILVRQAGPVSVLEPPELKLMEVAAAPEAFGAEPCPPPHLTRQLPKVLFATFVVGVCPLLIVSGIRTLELVHSAGLAVALGVALSLGASYGGSAVWRARPGSGDLLFGELMLWGWLRRVWIERQLKSALALLDGVGGPEEPSVESRKELLTKLAGALEARDAYTHGHSRRVARTATMIAAQMGLSHQEVAKVRTAAILHDVGKVYTPLPVLHKPGRLTDEEFDVIKRHPVDGAAMVSTLGDAELTAMVRHHHERLDGTGYPDRLSGDRIPLGARIISVADTFDAITSARPYRGASPHKKAIDILTAEAGAQLDPAAVRAFDSCYSGRKPLAVWAGLANALERLVSWLAGGLAAGGSASIAPVVALATLTGAAGGATASSRMTPAPARSAKLAIVAGAAGLDAHSPGVTSKLSSRAPAAKGQARRNAPKTSHVSPQHGGQTSANPGGTRSSSGPGGASPNGAGSGGQGATGGTPGSGTGSPNTGGGGTSSGGGTTGGGGTKNGGSSGPTVNVGGTSVSSGGTNGGAGVSVSGSTVSTGSNGASVSTSGSTVSTGSGNSGPGVSVGGTTVSTGNGGPTVTVGGTSANTGGGSSSGPTITVGGVSVGR